MSSSSKHGEDGEQGEQAAKWRRIDLYYEKYLQKKDERRKWREQQMEGMTVEEKNSFKLQYRENKREAHQMHREERQAKEKRKQEQQQQQDQQQHMKKKKHGEPAQLTKEQEKQKLQQEEQQEQQLVQMVQGKPQEQKEQQEQHCPWESQFADDDFDDLSSWPSTQSLPSDLFSPTF